MNRFYSIIIVVLSAVFFSFSVSAEDWTRVTDPSVLTAGDRIVIACPAKGKAAGDVDVSKKIMTAVPATFSEDGSILISAPDALVFTLGGEKDLWTLSDATGRTLGSSGVNDIGWNNYVHTWIIEVQDGLLILQSTSTAYGRIIYNVYGHRFTTTNANVSTSMLLPTLYRKSYKEYAFAYDGYPENTTRCVDIAYPEGQSIPLSKGQPVREGYTFAGWLYNGMIYQPGDTFVMPESDVALVAQWKANIGSDLPATRRQPAATKVLRDNTLYIVVGETTYDIMGNKR